MQRSVTFESVKANFDLRELKNTLCFLNLIQPVVNKTKTKQRYRRRD